MATFDAPAVARVDAEPFTPAEASPTQLSGSREESASLSVESQGRSTTSPHAFTATNTGTDLVKYDADFAAGQLTSGGNASASQLDEFGSSQG